MITVPGGISSFRTLADGTVRITVDLQEVEADKSAELLKMNRIPGFVTFSLHNDFTEKEKEFLKEIEGDLSGSGSQSQRIRNVLYIIHKKINNGKDEEFKEFYNEKTEEIIQHFKKKIPKEQLTEGNY